MEREREREHMKEEIQRETLGVFVSRRKLQYSGYGSDG